MVRRTRQSSFGVNTDSSQEKPEDRPGYRRNATTMSKVSRRGNTSARETVRDSSMSQFTGQINSHGIHLHVRVTAHPSAQQGAKPEEGQPSALPFTGRPNHRGNLFQYQGNHANYQREHTQYLGTHMNRHRDQQQEQYQTDQSPYFHKSSPNYADLPPDGRQTHGRNQNLHAVENDTGIVTSSTNANDWESKKPQPRRSNYDPAMLPPIDGGLSGMATFRGQNDLSPFEFPARPASFGTPTMKSPIAKPPTDRQGRGLLRDKTVSTIESVRFPDCSPAHSGIRRKRKKTTMTKEAKERAMNGKSNKHDPNLKLSLTDLTQKLYIGKTGEDKPEQHTLERSNENLDEEWKRYSSLGSNRSHEPVSIRKKIEQFKKWHEDQSREKLERLELVDSDIVGGKENINIVESKEATEDNSSGGPRAINASQNEANTKLPEVHQKQDVKSRLKSAKTYITWKTWRDVDDSYAYNDAKKYIEENELMTDEKEHWIKKWIDEVDREFFAVGRIDIASSFSGGSCGGATV